MEYFHTYESFQRPVPPPRRIGLLEKSALFATVTSPLSQQRSSLPPFVKRATEPTRRSLLASSARTKAALRVEEPLRLEVWPSYSAEQTALPQLPTEGLLAFTAEAQQADSKKSNVHDIEASLRADSASGGTGVHWI